MNTSVHPDTIAAICGAYHGAPFDVLGIHPVQVGDKPAVAVRVFLPQAREVLVNPTRGKPRPMTRIHPDGFFEALVPGRKQTFKYSLTVTTHEDTTFEMEDPYRFPTILSDFDLHLFSEGNNYRIYHKLGAHLCQLDEVDGVSFAVWAPSAERVSVIGHFNQWDGRRHPMRPRGATGIWELFIPGLNEWELYKYEIRSCHQGYIVEKADPVGFAGELRPKTSSLVFDLDRYQWRDDEWMENRGATNSLDAPISV